MIATFFEQRPLQSKALGFEGKSIVIPMV